MLKLVKIIKIHAPSKQFGSKQKGDLTEKTGHFVEKITIRISESGTTGQNTEAR